MNVTYTDKAKQRPEGLVLIQNATEQLEGVLGSSAKLVSAVWDRTEDSKGRTLYSLRISDFAKKEAQAFFAPDELKHSTHVRVRMYRLWGDLLEARSRQQLEELQQK